ncbi:uncharacterized protein K460DRAFT_367682 [Cucurbitaria berberidis CBS 394.84]|uniref:Uncharacterized protein n=1 Tax=Cucurbitaria berberidis CBS 394.84 TaxID=1168544 RepID=A0A9P4GCI3_9PLEO|nr:uncharacterized protein K460DRAFT_367682 [Cucurbitaria berberidis CBS 394.84]KAF1842724.1 hypothetical protein K460DRAFT_367682 [Cucurbitaria berberidis CBS 394.84]
MASAPLFSDLTSCLIFTPMDTSHLLSSLTCSPLYRPRLDFKQPYFPINGSSPLRYEYKVPGAWPDETATYELDTPGKYCNVSAKSNTILYESSNCSWKPCLPPTTSVDRYTSASPQDTWSAPIALKPFPLRDSEVFEDEQEDPEDYDPEYATYLLSDMVYHHEKEQRRENEEMYRIQCVTRKERYVEDEPRQWLGENLVTGDVRRAIRGQDRTIRASEDKKRWMRDGWERDGQTDTKLTMGEGTPADDGHRSMQSYFVKQSWKRKRGAEGYDGDVRDEMRLAKRPRRVSRGIMKTYYRKRERYIGAKVH